MAEWDAVVPVCRWALYRHRRVARSTLERMRATPFLERLDAALERPAAEPAGPGASKAAAPEAATDASVPAS